MPRWLNSFLARQLDVYKDWGDASGLMDDFMNDCFDEGLKGFKCYTNACHSPINLVQFVQEHRVLEHSHQVQKKDWEKGLA